jgi:hypothetical protein
MLAQIRIIEHIETHNTEGNKMTKAQKISEMILIELAATGSISKAFDKVFGEGTYAKLASDVYHQLRNEEVA